MSKNPVLGVVVLVQNSNGEILLVKRKTEPRAGYWSLPGGKVEFGETIEKAAVREIKEETDVDIEPTEFITYYESIHPDFHFFVIALRAKLVGGEIAKAGDDAEEVLWVKPEKISSLEKITNIAIAVLRKAELLKD